MATADHVPRRHWAHRRPQPDSRLNTTRPGKSSVHTGATRLGPSGRADAPLSRPRPSCPKTKHTPCGQTICSRSTQRHPVAPSTSIPVRRSHKQYIRSRPTLRRPP
ncbi:hypothetical protein Hypma_003760 [Hypsizygus marmoreus]|uniref:Uncharacterized protein n=1 Tax=Hypsizygus marmoreus TaxID=39966 RepID=A0A369J3L6_HYPMA|nr:hypothetical protein Hypma_003760 [Hypsizygus marmoreus]